MKIAIPTHRRVDMIAVTTLSLLKEFEKNEIYIFITDIKDFLDYSKKYDGYNLILCNTTNATEKFNFIQNYFKEGEFVFVIEDDIKKIQSLLTSNLKKLFLFMENFCNSKKISAFGVYPSSNRFFMSKTIDVGLTYIVANLYGFVSKKDSRLNCKLASKTDYERSVRFFNVYGQIARFNFISCITNNYKNKGGMQLLEGRAEIEKKSSLQLCSSFPEIFSINKKRKSLYTELRMVKKIKKINI